MERAWIHQRRGWLPEPEAGNADKHEELISRQGFEGRAAVVYRTNPPSDILRVEGDFRRRMLPTADMPTSDAADPRGEPTVLLYNAAVAISISRRQQPMPFCYQNAVADLLYFVQVGGGIFATEFGPIEYEAGDYVLIPKGVSFRHMPSTTDGLFLIVETRAPLGLTRHDQIGRHVPFDLSLLQPPELTDYDWPSQPEWELRIKHRGGMSSVFYPHLPFDIVGWKGDLFPFKINIRHIMPLMSERTHLAPSAWSTFENKDLLVATFVPQVGVANLALEGLPAYHRSIDADEVFFVGKWGAHPHGWLWHTPQGVGHGASPEQRAAFQKVRTPETRSELTAINMDVVEPLIATRAMDGVFDAQ